MAESGQIDWDLCKEIMICWNPGKKGTTQELKQAEFRVYDTLITRKQLAERPILTRRAAECIVDFCPDMLWRETLLRIVSEAGYGNKDVRDRFCYNGCHCDKATITKRIAAALGQKQMNNPKKRERQLKEQEELARLEVEKGAGNKRRRGPAPKFKTERYGDGEEKWHHQNQLDYYDYMAFFGKRVPGGRGYAGLKRKKSEFGEDSDDGGVPLSAGRGGVGRSSYGGRGKRTKSEPVDLEATTSPPSSEATELMEFDEDATDEETEEEGGVAAGEGGDGDEDAVSVQSDTILDQMED
jgi:hypothetical protein